jgi:aryl carrier-like protein
VTANGKVDRAALESLALPAGQDGELREPQHERRDQVARLLGAVLEREGIGADDDFFVCGGDSLRAVRFIGLIKKEIGMEVRLRDFMRNPTLSGLMRAIGQSEKPADSFGPDQR